MTKFSTAIAPVHHLLPILLICVLAHFSKTIAQNQNPNVSLGYQCASNQNIYPCQSYALYRADLTYLSSPDLTSVSDLFATSRLSIARSSNLSASTNLTQGQPLLIPITCTCTKNYTYALIPYQIQSGNTFYLVSTYNLANLTTYPAVELVNPELIPTNLTIGVITIFPIFCKCLDGNVNSSNGRSPVGLITYVLRPSDSYATVASDFGVDVQTLVDINGLESNLNGSYATIFVPLYDSITPPLLLSNVTSTTPASTTPPSASPTTVVKHKYKGAVIGLASAAGVLVALVVAQLIFMVCCWMRMSGKRNSNKEMGSGLKGGDEEKRFVATDDGIITDIAEWLDKYKVFKIEELRQATADFDDEHLIQGTVYKGTISGEMFAIKKMKWNACDELKILQKVNHTNLVKLEGFCIDTDPSTCYLVYEFVENGSLDLWLHNPSNSTKLDWRARLRIALDLANGLQYIHEHTWPRVVHKDIKTSNVLLDENFRAKIANFGLAKSGCNMVTTHIVGTQGYIAPEYLVDGLVTTKMDVFAYGVVFLQLITGREAVNEDGDALWMLVEKDFGGQSGKVKEGMIEQWVDRVLLEMSCSLVSVKGMLDIAMACLHRNPANRPSMVEVAYTLSKASEVFSDSSSDGFGADSGDVLGR